MEELKNKLDSMVWSFSRINSFDTCRHMWKMTYLDKKKGLQNGHAESGSLAHELLEDFSKGKLCSWDLVDAWENRFEKDVTNRFMYNKYVDLKEKAFNNGKSYFEEFEGFNDIGEVVSVEEKVSTKLVDRNSGKVYEFIGYIDLLLKDGEDYIVLDHKSKSGFKKGKVKGVQVDEQHDYARQLYCYAKFVKEKYGRFPKKLIFNMFNAKKLVEIDFDMNDYDEAIQWCCDVIGSIYKEVEFEPTVDYMFCNYLCGMREYCQFKNKK